MTAYTLAIYIKFINLMLCSSYLIESYKFIQKVDAEVKLLTRAAQREKLSFVKKHIRRS